MATRSVDQDDGEEVGRVRAVRSDSKRNRERLVAAARRVFTDHGGGASMEAVAREAGVGVGTLYRHFPQRIDLVEALYRTDVDVLVAAAEAAVRDLEPWPAVVAFLEAFVRYAQGKRTLINELHDAFDKNPDLKSGSRQRIDDAMGLVVGRAQRAGVMRGDVSGADVSALIGPMCTNATLSEEQSVRLLTLILDGLRAGAPAR